MNPILQHLARHLSTYGLGSGIFIMAFLHNWPVAPPRSLQDWWTWVREAIITALPVRRQPQQPPAA